MIGIYTLATIVGGIEFYRLKNVNEKFSNKSSYLVNNEEQKKSQNIELSHMDK